MFIGTYISLCMYILLYLMFLIFLIFIFLIKYSWAGISRSTSCIMAYLMYEHGLTFNKALELIRNERCIVNPNAGFRK